MKLSKKEQRIVNVLRGHSSSYAVTLGPVWFGHLRNHAPPGGKVNVAWIKDLRAQQMAERGYLGDALYQAFQLLIRDQAIYERMQAFVAPSELFAMEVMKWLGGERPWFQFMNYPYWRDPASFLPKRNEVVYIDNASTILQTQFYDLVLGLLGHIYALTDYAGVLVMQPQMYKLMGIHMGMHPPQGVRIVLADDYAWRSKYGLLVNVDGWRGAISCVPRKLVEYLHAGTIPLMHTSFAEAIRFCKERRVVPRVYMDTADIISHIQSKARVAWNCERFCMEAQIGALVKFLEALK